MIAISGWRGDTAEGAPALCNKTYSSLARRLCALYGLKLPGNQLDRVRLSSHLLYRVLRV